MSVLFKIILTFQIIIIINTVEASVKANLSENLSNSIQIKDHQSNSKSSISDQVEVIYPNLQLTIPTKQKTRLNKDPKFLLDQVEVFSKKNETIRQKPEKIIDESSDEKAQKFVSSRPLFVYRNEQRKKQRQNNGLGYYCNGHSNVPSPYPYPYSYYTRHGEYHYYPYGR